MDDLINLERDARPSNFLIKSSNSMISMENRRSQLSLAQKVQESRASIKVNELLRQIGLANDNSFEVNNVNS